MADENRLIDIADGAGEDGVVSHDIVERQFARACRDVGAKIGRLVLRATAKRAHSRSGRGI
jgi:hypothetical protein